MAFAITHEAEHGIRARRAFEWFLGRNRLHLPLYDFATGGCSDGLGSEALNRNEGAESTLVLPPCRASARRGRCPRACPHRGTPDGSRVTHPGASRELFRRHPGNPILTAEDWPYPANAVFNPGAAALAGETILLARVEDLSGISHLTVARSANGIDGWTVDPEPLLAPTPGIAAEKWGFEDPRVVWVDELERWVITCTSYGPAGPAVYLALTEDFTTVERHGIIRRPDDKNAALFPHRFDGQWLLLHRPKTEYGSGRGEIFLSRSADLTSWSTRRAGAPAPHGRLVGLAADRDRAAAAPHRARLAAGLPRREGDGRRAASTGSASPCSTSTSRRVSCTACPPGSSRRSHPTSAPATCRTSSSRAASCTTRRPASSASTTARPTPRSASPRRSSTTCSRPCSPRRLTSSSGLQTAA